ncbi:hypothetical protein A2U01_0088246, partial [Trifolium medium]|nr:hypothetical protein [Trifolium medium]
AESFEEKWLERHRSGVCHSFLGTLVF